MSMSSCNLLRDLLDLKDVYQLYKEGERIEEDLAEEILSRNRRSLSSFPIEEIEPDMTGLQIMLNDGIILLLRHVGYTEWENSVVEVLSNVVISRIQDMIQKFSLSMQRRKKELPTAFATPIQHSLCLHDLFNFIVLKQHYELNYAKPFRKLEAKVRSVIRQKKDLEKQDLKKEYIKVGRKRATERVPRSNGKRKKEKV